MENRLVTLLELSKQIPENYLEEAIESLTEIKEKAEHEAVKVRKPCPHCNSSLVVKNGKKHKKQAYLCRSCGKSFVETTMTARQNSHSSETVWMAVVEDTVDGVSLDETAEKLGISHATAFNMRHKILSALESEEIAKPTSLKGNCEADETYILESVKGKKIPEDYHRKARKHGAKASKRGISNEYVCVCTSVSASGEVVAKSVNRATPSGDEILQVFGARVCEDTLILCDGSKSYNALEDKCNVANTKRINKVNGFHSFIKERENIARGFSTKYLNRYNALFASVYGKSGFAIDEIQKLISAPNNLNSTINDIKTINLLNL